MEREGGQGEEDRAWALTKLRPKACRRVARRQSAIFVNAGWPAVAPRCSSAETAPK